MNLAAKLAEVMGEVGYVQKDAVNEFHHYKYASAEAVLKKVNAALSERGIAVATQAELLQYDHLGDQAGKVKTQAVVRLSLSFTDGETMIVAQGLGEGSDTGDKAVMKANTAAVKYALADAFMISWGDDPEADASTDKEVIDEGKVADWMIACQEAAEGTLEELKAWWPDRKATIVEACGEAGAAQVYAQYTTYLATKRTAEK